MFLAERTMSKEYVLVQSSWSSDDNAGFRHDGVAPLVQLGHNEWILELFQGPTLAFKDFALQLLGRLFDYVLERRQQPAIILSIHQSPHEHSAAKQCLFFEDAGALIWKASGSEACSSNDSERVHPSEEH